MPEAAEDDLKYDNQTFAALAPRATIQPPPPRVIPPSIGRRVWYWPNGCDHGIVVNGSAQACDAGIAYVWNERMINISVAGHAGDMHARTSVKLLQEGDEQPAPGACSYCTWMPFQLGQAKATS